MIAKKENAIKIFSLGLAVCLSISSVTGCSSGSNSVVATEITPALKVKSAKTVTTKTEVHTEYLDYNGFVMAQEVKNLSYGQSGRIEAVYVTEGQSVNAGAVLAVLDNTTLKTAEDSYSAAIEALQLSYERIKDTYGKTAILYEAGVISQKDYEDVKYSMKQIEMELKNTKQNHSSAISQLRDNSAIISPIDGYVISVTAQSGEITGAGTPVIIVKSENQIVKIGVTADDLAKIYSGQPVEIKFSGQHFTGAVGSVALYPDESSRTYAAEIIPEYDDVPIGAIVEVIIPLETREVVLIPISAILSNQGVNFIYVIEKNENGEDRAVRTEVILGEVDGTRVEAQNIGPGVIVVADNVKNIRENDIIVISE